MSFKIQVQQTRIFRIYWQYIVFQNCNNMKQMQNIG